jgi:hypothetical protein
VVLACSTCSIWSRLWYEVQILGSCAGALGHLQCWLRLLLRTALEAAKGTRLGASRSSFTTTQFCMVKTCVLLWTAVALCGRLCLVQNPAAFQSECCFQHCAESWFVPGCCTCNEGPTSHPLVHLVFGYIFLPSMNGLFMLSYVVSPWH